MRAPVRAFGSNVVHMADLPDQATVRMSHIGAEFDAVPLPAVMLCGAVLKRKYGYEVAVKMLPEVKVTCKPCKYRAGRW